MYFSHLEGLRVQQGEDAGKVLQHLLFLLGPHRLLLHGRWRTARGRGGEAADAADSTAADASPALDGRLRGQHGLSGRRRVERVDVQRLHGPLDEPDVDERLLRLELPLRR